MEYFGGVESFNKLKINDKIKNDYCEENYIELIRIKYDQINRIFEILKESLKNKKPN
jgi:Mor family transcriptional regulator